MAQVEELLRTLLLTFTPVTALTGTGGAARIRPDRLHQSDDPDLPAIIMQVDAETPTNRLDGLGGRRFIDVTLVCRARTKAAARTLAEAVRLNGTDPGTGLGGFKGTVSGTLLDAWLEDRTLAFNPKREGSDEGTYDLFENYVVSFAEVV